MIAYLCAIGIVALIYCLLALGLNLQFGLTRLVNFGVVAFFAVGAYTSGLLALQGVPLVLCFVAAGVLAGLLAGLLALPIGLLSLRLRDDYLAIVTLGFSEAVRISIQQESWLTKGVQGLPGLPKLFASWGSGVSDMAIFATLLAVVAVVAWGTVRLAASPFGRLLKAIGDDEPALSALGKDPAWFKVQVFMLGAALAALLDCQAYTPPATTNRPATPSHTVVRCHQRRRGALPSRSFRPFATVVWDVAVWVDEEFTEASGWFMEWEKSGHQNEKGRGPKRCACRHDRTTAPAGPMGRSRYGPRHGYCQPPPRALYRRTWSAATLATVVATLSCADNCVRWVSSTVAKSIRPLL